MGFVTVRTLRYYDKINLLKPSDYTFSISLSHP
ncbi:MerR family DNA-binding transcriptional regulator [Bacillus sp. D-CC]